MVGSSVVFGVLALFSIVFLLFDNVLSDVRQLFTVKLSTWNANRADRAVRRAEVRALKKREAEARKLRKRKAAQQKKASKEEVSDVPVAPAKAGKRGLKLGREDDDTQPFAPIMEDDPKPAAKKAARKKAKKCTKKCKTVKKHSVYPLKLLVEGQEALQESQEEQEEEEEEE